MSFTPNRCWLVILMILPLAICSCRTAGRQSPEPVTTYPAHWWQPVPAEGAPAWEILPQAAAPGEVILSKRNELGVLSNFAATPFTFRGKRYASVEGFWQMMKYPEDTRDPRASFPGVEWAYTREQVAQLTGFAAKHAGDLADKNMAKMGITWVSFEGKRMEYRPAHPGAHYQLIFAATREKVRQNPEVRKRSARHRQPDTETRPSPGTQCACRLALLRNSHRNPHRVAATPAKSQNPACSIKSHPVWNSGGRRQFGRGHGVRNQTSGTQGISPIQILAEGSCGSPFTDSSLANGFAERP